MTSRLNSSGSPVSRIPFLPPSPGSRALGTLTVAMAPLGYPSGTDLSLCLQRLPLSTNSSA